MTLPRQRVNLVIRQVAGDDGDRNGIIAGGAADGGDQRTGPLRAGAGAEHQNENVLVFMERLHEESMDIFSKLTDADLQTKCKTPAGADITKWKWLRLMTEHEIHHRGQIYLYLSMLGVPAPPLYGLTSEEVRARSASE